MIQVAEKGETKKEETKGPDYSVPVRKGIIREEKRSVPFVSSFFVSPFSAT
jgi:hypothetical protein